MNFGWKGLCSDAFPHGMTQRSCAVARAALWDEAGKSVTFDRVAAGDGVFSKLDELKSGRESLFAKSPTEQVTLVTKTAQQVFKEHLVPPIVDFLSLDVEGAELHVLKSIDHGTTCFRSVAVEHNHVEPHRSQIRSFLEGKGYTYAGFEAFDDYYTKACGESM